MAEFLPDGLAIISAAVDELLADDAEPFSSLS